MAHVVHRLEQALRLWEDNAYVNRIFYRMLVQQGRRAPPFVPTGPIIHADEFRQYVLGYSGEVFDHRRFIGDGAEREAFGFTSDLPFEIAQWCASSRRVFSLDRDLQTLLLSTGFGDMRWMDVVWPYDAFAIKLAKPINVPPDEHDMILVTRFGPDADGQSGFFIRLLSNNLQNVPRFTGRDKHQIGKLLKRGNFDAVARRLNAVTQIWGKTTGGARFGLWSNQMQFRVVDSYASMWAGVGMPEKVSFDAGEYSTWAASAKLVAGLCFYLSTLQPGSPHRSDWTPLSKTARLDPNAISNPAQICTVTSSAKLSAEERANLDAYHESRREGCYELSAHWRRGHWRRAPGSGGDPLASKTVWVRPTLVRKDRLADDELPGGSIVRT